jgi:hypothetical protein
MTHSLRGLPLSFCLGILCAVPAFTQTSAVAPEATSTGPVAYVYVQTSKGVNLYDASAAGKLTLVPGSPFQTEGSMGGSNGKYFMTVGTDYLHSYAVASNGAIGKQASEIDTQNYYGSECGNNTGSTAVLDHTGQNLYLMLINGQCMAQQTFDITKGSGVLKFSGAAVVTDFPADALEDYDCCTPLTITGNDAFGYVVSEAGDFWNSSVLAFARETNGALVSRSFNEIDPTPQPGQGFPYYYPPIAVAADPSGHLAALIYGAVNGNGGYQLASYTVDGQGNIASTNTWENMPTVASGSSLLPDDFGSVLSMSPSGKLLAVKIQPDCQSCDTPWGFQVFHFNGAAPATPYSPILLSNVIISQMTWDNSNHLYALGWRSGEGQQPLELYVYTVTPTSISEAPGSPYKIAGLETGLVVVSK